MPTEKALAEARKMLYDLLLSPYHESSHYQITHRLHVPRAPDAPTAEVPGEPTVHLRHAKGEVRETA